MQAAREYQSYEGAQPASERDLIAARGRCPGVKRDIDLNLTPGPEAAAMARSALGALEGRLQGDLLDDVRLLVSELITNSVRHSNAAGRVSLEVGLAERTLRVEVADAGAGFEPRPRVAGQRKDSGWGLYLVDRLADRWGVVRDPGTRVWFEIDEAAASS